MVRFVAPVAIAVFIAGISGLSAAKSAVVRQAPSSQQSRSMIPNGNAKDPWLYVTSGIRSVISIYDLALLGTPKIGEITRGLNRPSGLAIDSEGKLYAANYNNGKPGGTVAIYPPGSRTPSLTLSQGLSVPLDVTVDSSGNVYVLDRGSPPSIVVFARGQKTPSRIITNSLLQYPAQVVLDSSGDLMFTDNITGVSEIPNGSSQPVSLNLQGLADASGLALDATSGNIFVSDIHFNRVFVYAPGNEQPVAKFRPRIQACLLANGAVDGEEYIFVPACGRSGKIRVFRVDAVKPTTTLILNRGHGGACCIAFKPAGVP